jgi:hypothetical protein
MERRRRRIPATRGRSGEFAAQVVAGLHLLLQHVRLHLLGLVLLRGLLLQLDLELLLLVALLLLLLLDLLQLRRLFTAVASAAALPPSRCALRRTSHSTRGKSFSTGTGTDTTLALPHAVDMRSSREKSRTVLT